MHTNTIYASGLLNNVFTDAKRHIVWKIFARLVGNDLYYVTIVYRHPSYTYIPEGEFPINQLPWIYILVQHVVVFGLN